MKPIPFVIAFFLATFYGLPLAKANDTIKVVTYNTLNYGFPATSSCPGLLTFKKHKYLREILQFTNADLIGLVKMSAKPSSFTTDTIPFKVLDSICYQCYGHSSFTNKSGYKKENMLYYKKDKFGYISTTTLYSGDNNISDINMHRLYYKSSGIAKDTIFLNIIQVHLLSSSSSNLDRATEIKGALNYLSAHFAKIGNCIIMGDFNTQNSMESCYQQLVNPVDSTYKFYDPVNQAGDWNSFPGKFAMYLTQSTRLNNLDDCGANGGMSERFDHILLTKGMINGTDSISYIPGSYKVIGQDGKHTGNSLNVSPANTTAPANIINDLYYMSNHLPVELKLLISGGHAIDGIAQEELKQDEVRVSNPVYETLKVYFSETCPFRTNRCLLEIKDMAGQSIFKEYIDPKNDYSANLSPLKQGVYIMSLSDENGYINNCKIIKL
jgi:hypothetical protein